jgi:hypothetical protein
MPEGVMDFGVLTIWLAFMLSLYYWSNFFDAGRPFSSFFNKKRAACGLFFLEEGHSLAFGWPARTRVAGGPATLVLAMPF